MEIAAVYECDLYRRMPKRLRGIKPAEPSAQNDDAVADTFRIASPTKDAPATISQVLTAGGSGVTHRPFIQTIRDIGYRFEL